MDIKKLLQLSEDYIIESKDQLGRNQLHRAISDGNIKRIKELIKAHPEYMKEKDNFGKTPKDYAKGKKEILKIMEN